MCKAKKFEASIDTALFSLTSVTSNEIRILSPSNSINCEINKAEEFYKNNDPQIIKIKSPPFVTWWSEELKEDADLMETADKFVFYRSKEPYKVLGYTNPPSRVKYTVIAHDSGSELIYIWNML